MDWILDILSEIATSKYYKFLYVYIFIVIILHAKIVGWFATRKIYKILNSILNPRITNEIVNKIEDDIVRQSKLRDTLTEYYNYIIKAQTYFIIGLSSLVQLIILLHIQDVVDVGMNLSFLTMTISIMEFNDNIKASKNTKEKIDIENKRLINNFLDLNEMAIGDFAQKYILNEDHTSKNN